VLGESVGCQDQTLAAVGGCNLIEFRGMHDFAIHPVPFTPERAEQFDSHLLVFFTGIKRRAEEFAARQVQRSRRTSTALPDSAHWWTKGTTRWPAAAASPASGPAARGWLLKRELDSAITNDTIDGIYGPDWRPGPWVASSSAGAAAASCCCSSRPSATRRCVSASRTSRKSSSRPVSPGPVRSIAAPGASLLSPNPPCPRPPDPMP